MADGQLVFRLVDELSGEPSAETLGIMRALADRRDYFRLRDGAFLDLRGLDAWREAARAVTEAEPVEDDGGVRLAACRVAYLSSLLGGVSLEEDETVRETVRLLNDASAEDPADAPMLRPYQRRGLRWLSQLDRLRMGGVLADDMGLGKTVQIIALLERVKGEGEPSIVVAPTSLLYNWLSEINRFAPGLSCAVVSGMQRQREATLRHIAEAGDIDVVITSYPLIRRDIELIEGLTFRVAVLDEAQQIKNAGSQAAHAVKRLKARSRFALTGTPLENSVGELWSIFDYVLPGYLGSYSGFMRRWQAGEDADALRRRLRPFLLRRLKKEVLTELPDKLETVVTAQMTPEQEAVYEASLQRLRTHVDGVMAEKGFTRGRIEVLAALTELRQICCHPALVLDSYHGSSGKLDLLMDLLPGTLAAGHRVLLFSQFTGMLRLLRRQLEQAGIRCMYLDGETPAVTRPLLCRQFNEGAADLFLISLKAGGTGLNLTGADMVIHYDPWWNPAAEDQATDRAHRIGQEHKVEVVRLVTHGTVEEQVVELGLRKRALFDRLITPGEELVSSLTEQEIRSLFS